MGVIFRVDGPLEWCAAMVLVPKKSSESVRICMDLIELWKTFQFPIFSTINWSHSILQA